MMEKNASCGTIAIKRCMDDVVRHVYEEEAKRISNDISRRIIVISRLLCTKDVYPNGIIEANGSQ